MRNVNKYRPMLVKVQKKQKTKYVKKSQKIHQAVFIKLKK